MRCQSRVLIVDDNPTNVAVLEETLETDYHLATAASGEEALAIAPDFQPALILLDVMMPGINGYETCRRLRAHPALRYTKIIMVSAKAMVAERLEGYSAGADDYVTKPFDVEELLAKVRVYLRLKTLEEVDSLKTEVLLRLSHEPRTLLVGILPPLGILLEEEGMDAEDRRMWLEQVEANAERLQTFFEKVQTLSIMKSGMWDFQFTPRDLCSVVREAVNEAVPFAAEHNVRIDMKLWSETITLLDQKEMKRAMRAMLENAIRFSPSEGCVGVSVWREDNSCCVAVSDQGAGIAPNVLPYIFEEFASAEESPHQKRQGLSLALTRQVILAHNGTIGVESKPEGGTTFTVRVPVAVPPSEVPAPS